MAARLGVGCNKVQKQRVENGAGVGPRLYKLGEQMVKSTLCSRHIQGESRLFKPAQKTGSVSCSFTSLIVKGERRHIVVKGHR